MEDNPGVDMEDDVLEAPSQLKWSSTKTTRMLKTLHRVMLIAETFNKHHLTDMTANKVFSIEVRIYVFYISLKDLYLILLTHHPSFILFLQPLQIFLGTFPMSMKFLDFFDSPPRAGNNVDEQPHELRHTVAKRRASSRSPAPTILM
jgi:hypothetical protein